MMKGCVLKYRRNGSGGLCTWKEWKNIDYHVVLHCFIEGKRNRGRQAKTWIDNMKKDLKIKNLNITTATGLT